MTNPDAFVYDSPLDPLDQNDPRAIAIRLIGANKDVLELGPATGRVTRILHDRGCRVVAIEIDGSVAESVRPYCSELILGDLEHLPLRERLGARQFDVILAGDVLEHLTDPANLLRELKDYLSETGYLVVSIPNVAHGSVRLSLLQGKFRYTDIGILDRTHLRFFTLDTILQMLAEAGFAVLDVQRIRKDPFKYPYIEGPSLDGPDLPLEIRKLIENDPEAATVQFVVKAVLADSREALARLLVQLESQVQEKNAAIIRLEAEMERLQKEEKGKVDQFVKDKCQIEGAFREMENVLREKDTELQMNEAQIRDLEQKLADVAAEKDTQLRMNQAQIRDLEQKLADVVAAAKEARSANESLTSSLNRYKRLKNYFLPPGSFRESVCKRLAVRLLFNQTRSQQSWLTPDIKPPQQPVLTAPLKAESIIQPPTEWCDDPKQPPVVIAIPNWNRVELLRKCIESILDKTRYRRYRICVYEQGSTDGSPQYLQTLGDQVDSIMAPTNVGYVLANNAIIRRYAKWDVVFLNNDTEVTEGWLERLVATAYRADNIGLVGPKLIYADGRLQEAGSQVFRDGSARAYGKFADEWAIEFNQLREVDYCSAACLFAKRSLLDLSGGFDERYSPAYYEDTDLAFTAKAAGFKVVYEPRSTVIHHEYASSGPDAFERMESNRSLFVHKWSSILSTHQRNFWEATSLITRDKVLVIANIVPAPDRSAGGARFYEFIRLLARHYHVVLAYTETFGLNEYVMPLERLGVTVFYPGFAKAVHNPDLDLGAVLSHNDFRFVFFELFSMAEQYLGIVQEYSKRTVTVVDTYDIHFLREQREAAVVGDSTLQRKAQETKRRELYVYRNADLVLTVTEEDKNTLLNEDGQLNVSVIPLIHPLPEKLAPREERHDLLFVGGFSHRPNVDAVLYFCRDILPLVRKRLSEIKFYVVGNSPPPEIVALGSDSVVVTGYVPHLTPYLDSALVSIAPLRFGSGMKGKISEAMAYGVPVVTTTVGAEGMQLSDGCEVLIADNASSFAECVIRLVQEPTTWESIARNARRRAAEAWSPEAVERQLMRILSPYRSSKEAIAS